MPHRLLPLVQTPSLVAGADFAATSRGWQKGIAVEMLRSIPVIDRTRRVAKFHEGRTVNLGRWWRWLANVQEGIQFSIRGRAALTSCKFESSDEPAQYATTWRQRFVVSQDDGYCVNIWPMGTLKVTTCWSEAQPRQPAISSRGVPKGPALSRAGKRARPSFGAVRVARATQTGPVFLLLPCGHRNM